MWLLLYSFHVNYIFKGEGTDVPLNANAFCKKSDCLIASQILPGLYGQFEIFKQLERVLLKDYDEILVDINIADLPLFKSTISIIMEIGLQGPTRI